MYDHHLEAFVTVAELGSFSRAGEALYLSANAVIKQVNCLERDLGVTLFHRSARGAALTPAGEVVYRGALRIIAESKDILQTARTIDGAEPKRIRLASSAMRSIERIGGWWSEIGDAHPLIMLEIVPVMDNARSAPTLYERIGKDIDVLFAIEPLADKLLRARCEATRLFASPACIAVPTGHRLAARSHVSIRDLEGEHLYLTARGYTAEVEHMRDDMTRMGLRADIVDCAPYDADVFNRAAGEHALVLNCFELGRVHPAYTNVALSEPYAFPMCLVYSQDADTSVHEFVDAMAQCAARDISVSDSAR